MRLRKRQKIFLFGISILALPVLGYVITRMLIFSLDMNNDAAVAIGGFTTLVIILGIPYLMLKALFHNAHLSRGERELHARELPDHQPQNFVVHPINPASTKTNI